jgi:transposase IS66-like protein
LRRNISGLSAAGDAENCVPTAEKSSSNLTVYATSQATPFVASPGEGGQGGPGSDAGGERAAAIYSQIGSAKRNGIDGDAYLRKVLTRIADHPIHRIDGLLPWNLTAESLEN